MITIRTKITCLVTLLLCVSLAAREDTGSEHQVKAAFDAYKAAILAKDGKTAAEIVSRSTIQAYERFAKLAKHAKREELESLSFVDRFQVFLIRHCFPKDEVGLASGKGLFVYAVDNDWIGRDGVISMSVSSFDIANDRAVSDVFTSGRVLPYKFEYRKEDGEWKFDLMPVITSVDTVLPQLARESNIGENEFIFRLLEMQSGAKVTESIWDPLIPSGSIGFATRYGEITAVGSAEDKQVTTITALGVSMSIPATAKQVPIQDPAVVMYKAPESGLSWLIERRGNGTMRSLPVPLTKMAGMFADAIGYKEPIETVATEIGGEACERLSFSHRGKSFIMFVVFWSGYVYGLCVTSDKEYDGNLTSAGEKLRTSVEFTLPELYETPPRLSSLDDIGVIYNPYEGLWITPVGDDETIVLFDPKKRTTMIVHRSKATGADPNGPDIDKLRQQLQSEGFISVEISEVTVGGHRAWRSQGTVKTSKGEMNFCIIHMLRVGNYAYEMHGSADIDSRDALSEFVTEIVGKMTFR